MADPASASGLPGVTNTSQTQSLSPISQTVIKELDQRTQIAAGSQLRKSSSSSSLFTASSDSIPAPYIKSGTKLSTDPKNIDGNLKIIEEHLLDENLSLKSGDILKALKTAAQTGEKPEELAQTLAEVAHTLKVYKKVSHKDLAKLAEILTAGKAKLTENLSKKSSIDATSDPSQRVKITQDKIDLISRAGIQIGALCNEKAAKAFNVSPIKMKVWQFVSGLGLFKTLRTAKKEQLATDQTKNTEFMSNLNKNLTALKEGIKEEDSPLMKKLGESQKVVTAVIANTENFLSKITDRDEAISNIVDSFKGGKVPEQAEFEIAIERCSGDLGKLIQLQRYAILMTQRADADAEQPLTAAFDKAKGGIISTLKGNQPTAEDAVHIYENLDFGNFTTKRLEHFQRQIESVKESARGDLREKLDAIAEAITDVQESRRVEPKNKQQTAGAAPASAPAPSAAPASAPPPSTGAKLKSWFKTQTGGVKASARPSGSAEPSAKARDKAIGDIVTSFQQGVKVEDPAFTTALMEATKVCHEDPKKLDQLQRYAVLMGTEAVDYTRTSDDFGRDRGVDRGEHRPTTKDAIDVYKGMKFENYSVKQLTYFQRQITSVKTSAEDTIKGQTLEDLNEIEASITKVKMAKEGHQVKIDRIDRWASEQLIAVDALKLGTEPTQDKELQTEIALMITSQEETLKALPPNKESRLKGSNKLEQLQNALKLIQQFQEGFVAAEAPRQMESPAAAPAPNRTEAAPGPASSLQAAAPQAERPKTAAPTFQESLKAANARAKAKMAQPKPAAAKEQTVSAQQGVGPASATAGSQAPISPEEALQKIRSGPEGWTLENFKNAIRGNSDPAKVKELMMQAEVFLPNKDERDKLYAALPKNFSRAQMKPADLMRLLTGIQPSKLQASQLIHISKLFTDLKKDLPKLKHVYTNPFGQPQGTQAQKTSENLDIENVRIDFSRIGMGFDDALEPILQNWEGNELLKDKLVKGLSLDNPFLDEMVDAFVKVKIKVKEELVDKYKTEDTLVEDLEKLGLKPEVREKIINAFIFKKIRERDKDYIKLENFLTLVGSDNPPPLLSCYSLLLPPDQYITLRFDEVQKHPIDNIIEVFGKIPDFGVYEYEHLQQFKASIDKSSSPTLNAELSGIRKKIDVALATKEKQALEKLLSNIDSSTEADFNRAIELNKNNKPRLQELRQYAEVLLLENNSISKRLDGMGIQKTPIKPATLMRILQNAHFENYKAEELIRFSKVVSRVKPPESAFRFAPDKLKAKASALQTSFAGKQEAIIDAMASKLSKSDATAKQLLKEDNPYVKEMVVTFLEKNGAAGLIGLNKENIELLFKHAGSVKIMGDQTVESYYRPLLSQS